MTRPPDSSAAAIFDSRAEVDLGQIARNFKAYHDAVSTDVLVVVKANAYGHGLIPVAGTLARAGAAFLGVASPGEALRIRQSGIAEDVLVMGYVPPDVARPVIEAGCHFTVWQSADLPAYDAIAREVGQRARLHLEVDTGMGRMGVPPSRAGEFATTVSGFDHLDLAGLSTHFHSADLLPTEPTQQQLATFGEVVQTLTRASLRPRIVHAANSPGGLRFAGARFDMIRAGIMIYGYRPEEWMSVPEVLAPALSWTSRLTSVRLMPAGHGVGYNSEYRTSADERIGIVPVGYADGFRRISPNPQEVLVRGARVPVVGRVCMDQFMVNLDALPQAGAGDEVTLLGRQGEHSITAWDLARRWGTNPYEVLANIGQRVERVYTGGSGPDALSGD